jgi:carbonic anhydrase
MKESTTHWLDEILLENERFRHRVSPDMLPVQRTPGSLAVITCMDPRVNLEAIGIPGFSPQGEGSSSVRIIRTIGAMAEPRSLIIGNFLAGIREVVILMHTDCGCCLAYSKIDTIIENMNASLTDFQLQAFKAEIGEPFRENLIEWLKVFEDPREAVKKEIESIRSLPYISKEMVFHGLVFEISSGNVEVVVNGYDNY